MARTRATITTQVWSDPEWRALTPNAKVTYWSLLTQAKLTLAGVLDYMPERWADVIGLPVDDLHSALAELEACRYVLIDRGTYELAIRTFTRHDIGVTANVNTVKGMWSAWSAVLSDYLRHVIAREMPDELFHKVVDDRPVDAATMRATEPTPPERPSERPLEQSSERPIERSTEPTALRSPLPALRSPSPDQPVAPDLVAVEVGTPTAYPSEFETWWELYPRKVGKQKACDAWRKAKRKVGADALLAAVRTHAPVLAAGDPQFVPHPATWLNEGRYDDPPPTVKPAPLSHVELQRQKLAASLERMTR